MSDFTYDPPSNDKFLIAVKKTIENRGSKNAENLIKKCKSCLISSTNQFSRMTWNEYLGNIEFQIQFDSLDLITRDLEKEILTLSNSVMPSNCGIRLDSVKFVPNFDDIGDAESYIEEIYNVTSSTNSDFIKSIFDKDLISKGQELSNIFQILFIIENTLRIFVEKVLKTHFEDDYLQQITLKSDIKENVEKRKKQETKNQWIRSRGDSDIYYLDFIDLLYIIKNQWVMFKKYFPSQEWIGVKVDELYKCRCLLAHNSYIGEHEIDVIKTNYKSIVLQLKNSID